MIDKLSIEIKLKDLTKNISILEDLKRSSINDLKNLKRTSGRYSMDFRYPYR